MSWIDEVSYPWALPIAQQTHRNLVKIRPSKQMALLVAETSGINMGFIDPDQAIIFLWKQILDLAANEVLLRGLLQKVRDELNANHPFRSFFEGILNSGEGPVEAEPVDANGTPNFIKGSDAIEAEETLLFRDDLTLPIGKLKSLIMALQKVEALAPAVCRLVVAVSAGTQYGTAFRIGRRTLLTNHHVLHEKDTGRPAIAVTAQFEYDDNGEGGILAGTPFTCDVGSIRSDKKNDWAIIIVTVDLPGSIPVIDLTKGVPAQLNDQAFIVQHPLGGTKKIGYVRNTVSEITGVVAHYLTDTQDGSSGAPVFNGAGEIIALHRAGGRPVELAGMQPIKKNEGILIRAILDGFAEKGIDIV